MDPSSHLLSSVHIFDLIPPTIEIYSAFAVLTVKNFCLQEDQNIGVPLRVTNFLDVDLFCDSSLP